MQGGAKLYAVIDTNAAVSSLFSADGASHPAIVIQAILVGPFLPTVPQPGLTAFRAGGRESVADAIGGICASATGGYGIVGTSMAIPLFAAFPSRGCHSFG